MLRTIPHSEIYVGHAGPLNLCTFRVGERYHQRQCRVCGVVVSVDVTGRPVREVDPAPVICSATCLRPYMAYLMEPLERSDGEE